VSEPANLESPLWAFSLAVYGADGVEAECLALQERFGIDVNLLLYAAFAGAAEGVALERGDIQAAAAAVHSWHEEIVRPLRRARRGLKPIALDPASSVQAPAAALRMQVKAAELQSEKIEQAMLWGWFLSQCGEKRRGDRERALASNIRALLAYYVVPTDQADPDALLPRLCAAALAGTGL